MDRIGTRKGFSLAIIFWSVAAMAHALAHTVLGFGAARFFLGLGEAGNFPAAIKTVAEWFPKKERALATGIFNSGTNIGALVTPLVVPVITIAWGWRAAFIATGAIGFIWLVAWLLLYRRPEEHPSLSKAELEYIQSDPPDPVVNIPWGRLLPHRQTWAFSVAKFMTDPIWWVYLFWLPDFLHKRHGLSLKDFGPARRCLPDGGHRQHRGRLALVVADQARLDHQRRAEVSDVDLRACSGADRVRGADVKSLGGSLVDRACGCGASRLVVQSLHDDVRHVSATRSRIGSWHRRHGGCGWRHDDRAPGRRDTRAHGQLRAYLHHCRVGLPCGITSLSFIVTQARPS